MSLDVDAEGAGVGNSVTGEATVNGRAAIKGATLTSSLHVSPLVQRKLGAYATSCF